MIFLKILLLGGMGAFYLSSQSLDRMVLAMGTSLEIHLEKRPIIHLQITSEQAFQEVNRIETACSTWNSRSLWSRVNQAGSEPMAMDPEWILLLEEMKCWQHQTQGAFNPLVGALMAAWEVREGGNTPNQEMLHSALEASNINLLELASGTIRLHHPVAAIDEGAFLKGYALDRMAQKLRTLDVPSGSLNFGGQWLVWGKPQRIFIADPQQRQLPRLSVFLFNASLSTSGHSERGAHIVDPREGRLCPSWGSVSVVASTGLQADVLSTALYVMGPQEGLAWASQHDVAALLMETAGPIRMSPAFRRFNPNVSFKESQ